MIPVLVVLALVLVVARAAQDAPPAHLPGATVPNQTQRRDFLSTWYAALNRELPFLSVDARRLALAHAAYESGYGSGYAAKNARNPYNITAGTWWLGQRRDVLFQPSADDDYKPDGSVVRIDQTWRRYASPAEAVADYWAFLETQNGGRYRPAAAALRLADLEAFTTQLHAGGYFTFPVNRYRDGLATTLAAVMKELV